MVQTSGSREDKGTPHNKGSAAAVLTQHQHSFARCVLDVFLQNWLTLNPKLILPETGTSQKLGSCVQSPTVSSKGNHHLRKLPNEDAVVECFPLKISAGPLGLGGSRMGSHRHIWVSGIFGPIFESLSV